MTQPFPLYHEVQLKDEKGEIKGQKDGREGWEKERRKERQR